MYLFEVEVSMFLFGDETFSFSYFGKDLLSLKSQLSKLILNHCKKRNLYGNGFTLISISKDDKYFDSDDCYISVPEDFSKIIFEGA